MPPRRPPRRLVGEVTDDAVQQIPMDAEMPTTFRRRDRAEESVARFIDNLSKQIFQAEDALTEGYNKPGGGPTDTGMASWPGFSNALGFSVLARGGCIGSAIGCTPPGELHLFKDRFNKKNKHAPMTLGNVVPFSAFLF
ncbi:hypothetical protein ZWY2020_049716 [Hordeum vulgare]|nr:hypothetical protein ZWY2020_049716 [Hordeum vulgare]